MPHGSSAHRFAKALRKVPGRVAIMTALLTVPFPASPALAGSSAKAGPGAEYGSYPSTYKPLPSRETAIVNASILTAAGALIEHGTIVMRQGRILAVGKDVPVPAGAVTIDGTGKWVTPGVIDAHSHLGVFPAPAVKGQVDLNENVAPNTAEVWAEHAIWPQDPNFDRVRAGGVTSMLILPGSSNLFGGRGVAIKNVPALTAQAMKFPGAPYDLKMACGENPKSRYGSRGRSPATRMGNVAGYRKAWIDAADYLRKWDAYNEKTARGEDAAPPKRDLALETLAGVLKGEILVQNHCYRADEMATMIDLSKEFGYRITAFHHATEAYKVAGLLAANGICVATWADHWGFKMEAYDAIEENAAILAKAGVCVVMHSDSAERAQRLNVQAAIALAAGRRAGIDIPKTEAVKWFTAYPARIMGVADRTGTLEPGKMADVVMWNHDPFSIYAIAEKVFIDGALVFDADDPATQHRSDFELGQPAGDL
ncbi:amidohydrolase [Novosphingobium beihaiensis]|uniref:Amidohydrolase n=1 Tax=Novosphingobium beihaiensis TaxID=2930389 RepID=A0ABT0BL33_9SPHN|nr:amidohydrolase [Novosphingobium beihaiensis]MCJ2185752.1 amidohydrolase [Novosphingobium beihaiensis]